MLCSAQLAALLARHASASLEKDLKRPDNCCKHTRAHPQVVLIPVSLDGHDLGPPTQLAPFRTGEPLTPPRLSDGLGINPVVGPDRFSVFNISQDKPGFAYLLVTKPANQVNSQVCVCARQPHLTALSSARML